MTLRNSTLSARSSKPTRPKKPHQDFPLFAHANGQWAKKVLGKMQYFGPWDDHEAALNNWLADKDELLAGRVPRRVSSGCRNGTTLRDLVNQFLTSKQKLVDSGERSPHTWKSYFDICEHLLKFLGKDRLLTDILQIDFENMRASWAKRWGVVRLGAEVNRAKVVFNFAYKRKIVKTPFEWGEHFEKPSKKVMRLHKAEQAPDMFEADELRKLIEGASQPLRAMILLGINCGFGNSDICFLPMSAIDLKKGWHKFSRRKTGAVRRCPLWPETIDALREWIPNRPAAKNEADAELVFLTNRGAGWANDVSSRSLGHEMRKLMDRLKIKGRSFYSLRHTFATVASDSRDQICVDFIMGHTDPNANPMSADYRERYSDDRLRAVVEHVRAWLFSGPAAAAAKGGAA